MPQRVSQCTFTQGDELAECKVEPEPGSNKIGLVGRLRSEMRPLVTGIQHDQAFVMAMPSDCAGAVHGFRAPLAFDNCRDRRAARHLTPQPLAKVPPVSM
jgi:hypothetical protein